MSRLLCMTNWAPFKCLTLREIITIFSFHRTVLITWDDMEDVTYNNLLVWGRKNLRYPIRGDEGVWVGLECRIIPLGRNLGRVKFGSNINELLLNRQSCSEIIIGCFVTGDSQLRG